MDTTPNAVRSTFRRRWLSIIPIGMWLVAIGVIVWSQTNELMGMGYRAAFAAGSVFVASISTLIWFSFCTGFSRTLRYSVFGLCLATLMTLTVVFRIDEVSGGLIPTLAFRWSLARDEAMEQIDTMQRMSMGSTSARRRPEISRSFLDQIEI